MQTATQLPDRMLKIPKSPTTHRTVSGQSCDGRHSTATKIREQSATKATSKTRQMPFAHEPGCTLQHATDCLVLSLFPQVEPPPPSVHSSLSWLFLFLSLLRLSCSHLLPPSLLGTAWWWVYASYSTPSPLLSVFPLLWG